MGEKLLLTDEVAALAGVAPNSIKMYLRASRRKQEAGEALAPADLPIPDPADAAMSMRNTPRPRWRKSRIDRWLKHRQVGGGPRRKAAAR